MKKRTWLFVASGAAVILPGILVGSWVATETIIQATSGQDFCTACHSMTPFATSYRLDIHGGNNSRGLVAACADCHLPHESPANTLIAKASTGISDAWSQLLSIVREPDWIGNLERRTDFVFDSGCLRCHANLAGATNAPPVAALAHNAYFADPPRMPCVSCHQHVGHKDLLQHLPTAQAATNNTPTAEETAQ